MNEQAEKTRVLNFLKKSIDIDMGNLREVADNYRKLNEVVKLAEKEMDVLKSVLVNNKVEEYFLEEEEKVVYQEGRNKTFLNTEEVYKALGLESFIKVASVSEKAIRDIEDLTHGEKETVIGQSKVILEEKTRPSIKVGKITKKELKEMRGL